MALYSLSCSIYSFTIEKLVKKFRARPVYAGGQLVYSIGMVFMALARSKLGVIVFSCSAGIMYSTLFTMPYLIVAHYHETDTVSFHKSNVSKYYYILTYIITSTLPSRQNKRNLCYGPIQVTGVLRNFYCNF